MAACLFLESLVQGNIPHEFTGSGLLSLLNQQGFKGAYDLVYLPHLGHELGTFGGFLSNCHVRACLKNGHT